MFAVILVAQGARIACAQRISRKLSSEHDDFNFRYIDIHAEGITKADLENSR